VQVLRIGRERPEVRAVIARDGDRCVACGFDLACALAAHHRLPRELGGRDTPSNLTTLCSNCHKAVHWFSVDDRLGGHEGEKAKKLYSASAFAKLVELAQAIQGQRVRTKRAGNRWLKQPDTHGPTPLADGLELLSSRNHFDSARTSDLGRVVYKVLQHLPAKVLSGCSIRLVQRGRFLSINAGNTLLFRVPGVFDGVKDPDGDVLLIWPEGVRLSVLSEREWREIEQGEGRFAAVAAFNLPLDFKEVLDMNNADWRAFTKACRDAVRHGKSRCWVSNVELPTGRNASAPSS
jgi:hypothetical protein